MLRLYPSTIQEYIPNICIHSCQASFASSVRCLQASPPQRRPVCGVVSPSVCVSPTVNRPHLCPHVLIKQIRGSLAKKKARFVSVERH